MNPSEFIESFLNRLDEVRPEYDWHYRNVGVKDLENQDFLHELELVCDSWQERSRLATKWRKSRIERRESKNMVAVLEPVVKFLDDEANRKVINRLRGVLGEVRKQEGALKGKVYRKRVTEEMRKADRNAK